MRWCSPRCRYLSRAPKPLKRRLIMLPLLFQLRHKSDVPIIFVQTLEIRVVCKKWIAGKAVIGSVLQPFDREFGVVHEGVSRGDVVGGVMKMAEAPADFNGLLTGNIDFTTLPVFRD